eukprot:Skav203540  [mRNA]  locus=scaffold2230:136002:136637:- [translate_table: standard]
MSSCHVAGHTVKMVAETRVSWTLLLLITLGCFIESQKKLGTASLSPVAFMVLAHLLYGNACAKGGAGHNWEQDLPMGSQRK